MISSSKAEHDTGIDQINNAVTETDSAVQHTAAVVEATAAQALSEQTVALNNLGSTPSSTATPKIRNDNAPGR